MYLSPPYLNFYLFLSVCLSLSIIKTHPNVRLIERRIFWTNWNPSRPAIQTATYKGHKAESIITDHIRTPNGLAIDYKAQKLYWSDARLDKIERINYDGSERVVSTMSRLIILILFCVRNLCIVYLRIYMAVCILKHCPGYLNAVANSERLIWLTALVKITIWNLLTKLSGESHKFALLSILCRKYSLRIKCPHPVLCLVLSPPSD